MCTLLTITAFLTLSAAVPVTTTATTIIQQQEEEHDLAQTNDDNSFKTYENPTYGIKIQYPSNWRTDEGDVYADDYVTDVVGFIAPLRSYSEEYATSLWISIENLPPNQDPTLNEYLDQTIDAYYETFQQFEVIEYDTDSILAGKPAYRLVSTDEDGGIHRKSMEIGTIMGDKAYFITYDTEEEQYYDHLPTIQKMVGSLRIMSSSDRLDTDPSIIEDSEEINPYAGR